VRRPPSSSSFSFLSQGGSLVSRASFSSRTNLPPRLAFIGSLIYASIIYHRARRARHLNPTNPDPFSPATDYSGRTAPPRYGHGYAPGMEEERLELAEGGEERQMGMGRGEGRREELEGEGRVYELDARGSGRRRAELRG